MTLISRRKGRTLVPRATIRVQPQQDHIFQWNVEKYKQYHYEKEPWFEAMPEELVRTLEKELGWHLLITCEKPLA